MADKIEKIILDDTQFLASLNKMIDKTEEADKAFKELNDEIETTSTGGTGR